MNFLSIGWFLGSSGEFSGVYVFPNLWSIESNLLLEKSPCLIDVMYRNDFETINLDSSEEHWPVDPAYLLFIPGMKTT